MKIIILLIMLFLHIVDDYYLQGILAKLKQKSWWEENAPDKLYKNDYVIALIEHSFSWTFMIMLPFTIMYVTGVKEFPYYTYMALFVFNTFMHSAIDNLKANDKIINLTEDQLFHMLQIIITWIALGYTK